MSLFFRDDAWWYDFTINRTRYRKSTGTGSKQIASGVERLEFERIFNELKRSNPAVVKGRRVPKSRCLRQGTIYFIQCEETCRIKVGWTENLEDRLRAVQANSPTKLRVLASVPGRVPDELKLHRQFASDRLHFEWFSPSPALLAYIELVEGVRSKRA